MVRLSVTSDTVPLKHIPEKHLTAKVFRTSERTTGRLTVHERTTIDRAFG